MLATCKVSSFAPTHRICLLVRTIDWCASTVAGLKDWLQTDDPWMEHWRVVSILSLSQIYQGHDFHSSMSETTDGH